MTSVSQELTTTCSQATPEHFEASPSEKRGGHRISATLRRGGVFYFGLHAMRWLFKRWVSLLERPMVAIEQRKGLVEGWTVSAQRFTVADNVRLWNTYDWSQKGEEWTPNSTWKEELVRDFLVPYMPELGTLVEIGPGGGRWTEFLQRRASTLYVVDVAERALQLCRERFAACHNIKYILGDGTSLNIPTGEIEGVWSYDVFVHINPVGASNYFREIARLLKPGGIAVIHHPGNPAAGYITRTGWRSDLTEKLVLEMARQNHLQLLQQTDRFVNPGDVLSVFQKPLTS
jgi:SAM-dependent methyltransferase